MDPLILLSHSTAEEGAYGHALWRGERLVSGSLCKGSISLLFAFVFASEKKEFERAILKGLSINPIYEYEFAVACGDEFVRIFDLRMNHSVNCTQWIAPEHLVSNHQSKTMSWYRHVMKSGEEEDMKGKEEEEEENRGRVCHTTFVEYSHG